MDIFDKSSNDNILITEREQEVLELISLGLSNEEISDKLFISFHTTKAHLASLYRKFNMIKNTNENSAKRLRLVLEANRLGFINLNANK